MPTVVLALALLVSSCTSATTSSLEAPVRHGPVVAVAVLRANPVSGSGGRAAVRDDSPSTVDAGSQLASPIDPLPTDGLETAEGRSHLGDLYARAGLMPEAIFEYRQAIGIDPSNAVGHFKLGLAYQSMRNFDDALLSYREAAILEPDSAWAHAAVSIVLAKMGRPEMALDAYRSVKRLDDEMAEGLLEVITQYGTFHEV